MGRVPAPQIHLNCMRAERLLNGIFSLIALGFFVAIAWIWYGHWRIVQQDNLRQLADVGSIKLIDLPVQTSTLVFVSSSAILPTVTPVLTVSTTEVTTSPRTAISLLKGTLVLGPSDVNIEVPYTSQAPERDWAQPWQDACEEASALMLDAYYRNYGLSPLSAKDEIVKLIDWQEKKGWGTSIPIENIKIILQEYFKINRPIRLIANPTVTEIKKLVAAGKPVLAVVDGRLLKNPYYSGVGPVYHALIIRGYTNDVFITNDPGVNRGKNFPFPIEVLMNALHDWNDGDVTHGMPMILVVE